MAIIDAQVTQGVELKTSSAATQSYVADRVMFDVGGLRVTQNVAIALGLGLLVGALVKA